MASSSFHGSRAVRRLRSFRKTRLLQVGILAFAFYTAALAFPLLALTISHLDDEAEAADAALEERSRLAAASEQKDDGQARAKEESEAAERAHLDQDIQRKDAELQKLAESLKQASQARAAVEQNHAQWLQWLKTADRKQIDAQIAKLRAAPSGS